MSWSSHLTQHHLNLQPPPSLPPHITILSPLQNPAIQPIIKTFYHKYYNDTHPRTLLIGINPGRFGAGITGINFTAPRQLSQNLHIPHNLGNGSELSAEFIYKMIGAYGQQQTPNQDPCQTFYNQFILAAALPMALLTNKGRNGRWVNVNYYDTPELLSIFRPLVIDCISQHVSWGANTNLAFIIGEGKNFSVLSKLNEEYKWFKELKALPHPRWIMQYRRKRVDEYISHYVSMIST